MENVSEAEERASARSGSLALSVIEEVLNPVSVRLGSGRARLATFGPYEPKVGDRVLVGEVEGALYVVGVIRALREAETETPRGPGAARLEDGTAATVEEAEDGRPVLRVRDPKGALLFEHREGETLLSVPVGHLRLSAPQGDVRIEAGGAVKVEAAANLDLSSRARVRVRSASRSEESSLELSPRSLFAKVAHLRLDGERAEAVLEEASLFTTKLKTVAREASERFLRFERESVQTIERAKDLYREVEGLEQTRAGRIRLFAEKAFSAVGQSVVLRGEEHVTVDGEKIYLG